MPNNSQQESTTTATIRTAGEIFPSGAVIEVVSTPNGEALELALWKDRQLTVGPQISVDGQCFVPLEINPTIRNAMTFPRSAPTFTNSKHLLASLAKTFEQFVGFSTGQSLIPAAWTVTTWLPEFHYRLPEIKKLTRFINTLIRTRGECYEYNEVEIGRMASNLDLPRVRNGSGMVIRFTADIQQRLHQLASDFGLSLTSVEGCRLCGGLESVKSVKGM